MHYSLLTVLVTALAGTTILKITPHHSYYCCGISFMWIRSGRSTAILMYILALARWCQHEVISITKWPWTDVTWLLAISVGIASMRLEGVNLDCLTFSSKFNPNFLVLSNLISYLLSESLLSLRHFLDLREAFWRVFSNLSNFLLDWAKTALLDLVFYLPYWWCRNWLSPFRISCTCNSP